MCGEINFQKNVDSYYIIVYNNSMIIYSEKGITI